MLLATRSVTARGSVPLIERRAMSSADVRPAMGAVEKTEAARLLGISVREITHLIRWGFVLTCKGATRRHMVPLSEIDRERALRRSEAGKVARLKRH